jgi:hypothetical protein
MTIRTRTLVAATSTLVLALATSCAQQPPAASPVNPPCPSCEDRVKQLETELRELRADGKRTADATADAREKAAGSNGALALATRELEDAREKLAKALQEASTAKRDAAYWKQIALPSGQCAPATKTATVRSAVTPPQ